MRNAILILSLALLLSLTQPGSPAQFDHGTMTMAEQDVFHGILSAVDAGQAVVWCEGTVNHDRVRTHLGLYYGTVKGLGRLYTVVNGNIHLNLKVFPEFARKRAEVQRIVEEALPHIRKGTDRYMLRQIARYIAGNFAYGEDFVCGDYSVLFYKMASRLGIHCCLCFGRAEGQLHVWNYAAGRYYDITWYDGTGERKYIGSKNAWGRSYAINDMWEVLNNDDCAKAVPAALSWLL